MTRHSVPDPLVENGRPVVGRMIRNRAPWMFGVGLLIAAAALFSALEARRAAKSDPMTKAQIGGAGPTFASPPDLAIPQDYGSSLQNGLNSQSAGLVIDPRGIPVPDPAPQARQALPQIAPTRVEQPALRLTARAPRHQAPVDLSTSQPPVLRRPQPAVDFTPPSSQQVADPDRQRASRLSNPGTTVPKGTVIHAVLETALDSTRAGAARAIVSRDVSSFDGTQILIPKGSKLIGEYASDLTLGQNRALIQWQRLVLPGGWIIDIDSPSADALGRAGVKGKVDTHFLARFGGAILQSVLDLGVQVAARKASGGTVIIGLPGGSQNPITKSEDIRPTLKVKQGSSVTVFVARDLDFTDVVP